MKRHLVSVILCGLTLVPAARGQTGSYLGKNYFDWIPGLSKPDAAVRRSAVFALGKIGDGARRAVPQIAKLLETDPDAGVRETAAAAIGDMLMDRLPGAGRELAANELKALQRALEKDADPRVRRSAAYALGACGPQAAPAVDLLVRSLQHEDASVRQNAAWALGQIGPEQAGEAAVEPLCAKLRDADALVRRDAAGALGLLGRPAAVEPLLGLVNRERDDVVLRTALDALAHLAGEANRGADTAALERLLNDADEETQRGAAFVLARIGGAKAVPAMPVLRKALADEDPQVQALAAAGLAVVGKEAAPAVPDLARALRESADQIVRRNAALALGHIGPDAKPAVPALVEALRQSEPVTVRRNAAWALALIALPHIQEAVPALLEAISKETDPLTRQRCVFALFHYTKMEAAAGRKLMADARPVLSEVLEGTAPEHALVRFDAARLMAFAFESKAPDRTVDVLLQELKNKDLLVFNGIDTTVVGAGSEAGRGTSQVKDNTGGDGRYMAAEALGWLGEKSSKRKDVVEALRAAARDPDAKLKEEAKKALKYLGLN
jgi:HEAT repeat protein